MKYYALIPAAGQGIRMQHAAPKQYLPLRGHPLLWHAIAALSAHPAIAGIVVVLRPGDPYFKHSDYATIDGIDKLQVVYCGGETRAASVRSGLQAIAEQVESDDWVLVHDAVRPCLSGELISRLINTVSSHPIGGILAVPVADTVKVADSQQQISQTLTRTGLWLAQTPQMFRYEVLCQALAQHSLVTDEASALEAQGHQLLLVQSSIYNLKVTYPDDLLLVDAILSLRENSHD